jgi:hypothetical protein
VRSSARVSREESGLFFSFCLLPKLTKHRSIPHSPRPPRPPAETKGLTLEEVRAVFEREVGMDGRRSGRGTADSLRRRSARGDGNDVGDLDDEGDGYHVIADGDGDEDEDESDLEQAVDADHADADPSEAEGQREPDREHSRSEVENRPGPLSVAARAGLEA